MHFSTAYLLTLSICLSTVVSGLRLDSPKIRGRAPAVGSQRLTRRGEPTTGDDDFPDTEPHPNHLDQVETAFNDTIELTSYVKRAIDSDTDIFPHYFNEEDRDEVKRIFTLINNDDKGNDTLKEIHVQTNDQAGLCNGNTLAYFQNGEKDATKPPFLVLCPNAFNKKAVTELKGADPQDPAFDRYYAVCDDLGDFVSFVSFQTCYMNFAKRYSTSTLLE